VPQGLVLELRAQKSKECFRRLLDIVRDPAVEPSAVLHQLGRNQFDGDVPEWLDEDDGWKCSSVVISVSFHTGLKNPGPKDYTVNGFHHHPLLSIIKEKITNLVHASPST
jgi:hypothetical protein